MAHLEHSSVIEAPRLEVFQYVCHMANLPEIVAGHYKIESLSPVTELKKDTESELRVSRFGVSVNWGFIVEDFKEGEYIRQRQTHGPFGLWVQTEKFEDHGKGCLITDFIEYDLPYGLFGKLAEDLFVSRDLLKMISRRHEKIRNHFGPPQSS